MATLSDALMRDIRGTLELLPRWRLDPAAWAAIEAGLPRLSLAMQSGDGQAAHDELVAIEDHGPTRLAAIRGRDDPAAATRRPPPDRVTELLNRMIHPAGGWSPATAPRSGAEG